MPEEMDPGAELGERLLAHERQVLLMAVEAADQALSELENALWDKAGNDSSKFMEISGPLSPLQDAYDKARADLATYDENHGIPNR